MIESGVNGILVPVGDKQALQAAMRKVLLVPELAERLGENAKEVQEKLYPDKIYARWAETILGN